MRQTLGSSAPTSTRVGWPPSPPPDGTHMGDREPVAFVTAFSRALRACGLPVTPASSIDAVRALAAVDVTDKFDVYFALRSVLATRRSDFVLFDRLFDDWWGSDKLDDDSHDRTAASKRSTGNP